MSRRVLVAVLAVIVAIGGLLALDRTTAVDPMVADSTPALIPDATATTTTPTVTMTFVGDTILGNTPSLPANPATYLSSIATPLAHGVDLVFGNLEGTLTTATASKCGSSPSSTCFAFRNPPSFARSAFAHTGFGLLNLANNHSHDFGTAGYTSTRSALRGAGIADTGAPGQITYLTRKTVRLAFVAFAPYSTSNNLLNLTTAAHLIRTARAHADVVVVYMHAGAEGSNASHVTGREEYYVGEDRGNPKRFAHMAIDNGASLVVASGPHVLRGMEFYKNHLIAYSLGNFANYHNFGSSGVLADSMILRVTLAKTGAFRGAGITSVVLDRTGHATVGGSSVSFVSTLSRQDFGTAAPVFERSGSIRQR